jgi:hypothetical protein
MPWYERDLPTPFDTTPINGLASLHGDIVARRFGQEWARGKKYPLITFPSGTSREVTLHQQTHHLHLFGTFTFPRSGIYDEAVEYARSQAQHHPLQVFGDDERNLVVVNRTTRRGYALAYDNDAREIVNVTSLPRAAMELLPDDLRAVLPPLYATEKQGMDTVAPLKFFTPDANWTWYPTEFDGKDVFFGLVSGYEVEIGYFTLSELENIRGLFGLPIERDLHYTPQPIQTLKSLHEGLRP